MNREVFHAKEMKEAQQKTQLFRLGVKWRSQCAGIY